MLRASRPETSSAFCLYASSVPRRFGIENDQALDLFNQTVSVRIAKNTIRGTAEDVSLRACRNALHPCFAEHKAALSERRLTIFGPLPPRSMRVLQQGRRSGAPPNPWICLIVVDNSRPQTIARFLGRSVVCPSVLRERLLRSTRMTSQRLHSVISLLTLAVSVVLAAHACGGSNGPAGPGGGGDDAGILPGGADVPGQGGGGVTGNGGAGPGGIDGAAQGGTDGSACGAGHW